VVVRNYEGFISAYAQPEVYQRHDPHTCPSCRQHEAADEGVQEGVSALLRGATLAIKPEGFEATHRRRAEVAVQVPTVQLPVKSNGNGNGNGHRAQKTAELELAAVAVQAPVKSNGNGNGHKR
jgi:hypothetical protein